MAENVTVTAQKVADDPNTGEFVVYFVEDGPWPDDAKEFDVLLKRLQDTILDAADAAIDGGIATVYPDTVGKRIRIQVDSPNGCPQKVEQLVKNIDKYLAESDEYASAIKQSQFISGMRVVTGHMLGRFKC
jgi:hypothetical protein